MIIVIILMMSAFDAILPHGLACCVKQGEKDRERKRERKVKIQGAPGDVVGPPPRSRESSQDNLVGVSA